MKAAAKSETRKRANIDLFLCERDERPPGQLEPTASQNRTYRIRKYGAISPPRNSHDISRHEYAISQYPTPKNKYGSYSKYE